MDDTPYQLLLLERDQTAAQLTMAADFAGIAVWHQDSQTGMVRVNAQAASLFGIEQHSVPVPLSRMRLTLHPDDRASADAADAAAFAGRGPVDAELRYRGQSRDWRRLFTRRGVHADAPDGVVMLVGIAIDESAAASALLLPTPPAQLFADTAGRYRFLARLSHELRTPMNAVLGFAQLLNFQDSGAQHVPPARSRAVSHITKAGQHMMALINDVMDLSRLEGGEMPLSLQPLSLRQAAAGALSMLELPIRERRIGWHAHGLDSWVLADATRLTQVLLNLVGNAIKYGREGGRVSMEGERMADGVHVRIADDGRGMSAEQLLHVFEPFNRLGFENTAIQGTGLGLSISKMLVERMGGRLSVRSEPSQGTTLEMVLMAAEAPEGALPFDAAQFDALLPRP